MDAPRGTDNRQSPAHQIYRFVQNLSKRRARHCTGLILSKSHTRATCRRLKHQPASPGRVTGTFQTSSAYSPMVRSEENHAMLAMFSMLTRVHSEDDIQSRSMLRWASQ